MPAIVAEQSNEPLTSAEQCDLGRLERVIDGGRRAFVEVGRALMEIRDRRLYRVSHETFADYVEQRWDFKRAHAYRLIGAHETMEVLSPFGDTLPANLEHVRPLLRFPVEDRAAVWQDVLPKLPIDENGQRIITGKVIEQEVRFLARTGNTRPYRPYREAQREEKQERDRRKRDDHRRRVEDEEDRKVGAEIEQRATCPNCGNDECDDDGDCTKCREPAVVPVERAEAKPKPAGKGVILANEAINALKRIPKNDALRARAWEIVRDWLDANES